MDLKILQQIRKSENIELKLSKYDNPNIILRNYQKIGVANLLLCKNMLLGDDVGLGKTCQMIFAFSRILDKDISSKLIIVCPTSLILQWQSEFNKFAPDINVLTIMSSLSVKKRENLYVIFEQEYNVLVTSYGLLVNDLDYLCKFNNYSIVFDEIATLKSGSTATKVIKDGKKKKRIPAASQRHIAALKLTQDAKRIYGLSATPIKNKIMELWSIFRIIKTNLFPDEFWFKSRYCIFKDKKIYVKGGGGRTIIIKELIGYKNLEHLKQTIFPYYLGRKKSQVAKELPKIINKEIYVEITGKQKKIYNKALEGLIESLEDEDREINPLSKLLYCQIISDSTEILKDPIKAPSAKVDELIRLLEDELSNEKVIIYSKFEKLVSFVEKILDKKKINCLRITGKEDQIARESNKQRFQTSKDHNIIFITNAGGEGINLQSAGVVLFFDLPFSMGDYIQIIGRAHRIGSVHKSLLIIHLMSARTMDSYVLEILKTKMGLIERIFDKQEGILKFKDEDMVDELRRKLSNEKKSDQR